MFLNQNDPEEKLPIFNIYFVVDLFFCRAISNYHKLLRQRTVAR